MKAEELPLLFCDISLFRHGPYLSIAPVSQQRSSQGANCQVKTLHSYSKETHCSRVRPWWEGGRRTPFQWEEPNNCFHYRRTKQQWFVRKRRRRSSERQQEPPEEVRKMGRRHTASHPSMRAITSSAGTRPSQIPRLPRHSSEEKPAEISHALLVFPTCCVWSEIPPAAPKHKKFNSPSTNPRFIHVKLLYQLGKWVALGGIMCEACRGRRLYWACAIGWSKPWSFWSRCRLWVRFSFINSWSKRHKIPPQGSEAHFHTGCLSLWKIKCESAFVFTLCAY